MDDLLERLSDTVTRARSVEELARPFLQILEELTGMESTYLTRIDLMQGVQQVLYARNSRELRIPEGLSVPWDDTLCRRALDSQRFFTPNVSDCWGDSQAAQALGIRSYLSTPVRLPDGTLYGTLCAASAQAVELDPVAMRMLPLFATLIAQQVEREALIEKLVELNRQLTLESTHDPLTGLPNRRHLTQELRRMLAIGQRQGFAVLVAFIDLDGFKAINDRHGHAAGDAFLQAVGARLQAAARSVDLPARLGGDEFVVIGPGPSDTREYQAAVAGLQERLGRALQGRYDLGAGAIDYAGPSIGVVAIAPGQQDAEEALEAADAVMYAVKRQRKATPAPTPQA